MSQLPVIDDCSNCGVCCYHMGYPAYMLPRPIATAEQIKSDPKLQDMLNAGWTEQELLDGHPGEPHWHQLPKSLKDEWLTFVAGYSKPKPGELDGQCFWQDTETGFCKHHEYRPQVCRDFEAGCQECRQWRRQYNID